MHTRAMSMSLSRRHVVALGLFAPVWSAACSNDESGEEPEDGEIAADELLVDDAVSANEGFVDAREATRGIEERYARILTRVGLVLSDSELHRFGAEFEKLEDVARVRKQALESAEKLDKTVAALTVDAAAIERVMATLKRQAAGGKGPVTVRQYGPPELYESMKFLATTMHAPRAMKFALQLLANDPVYAKVSREQADVTSEILLPAVQYTLLRRMIEKQDSISGLRTVRDEIKDASDVANTVKGFLEQLEEQGDIKNVLNNIPTRTRAAFGGLAMLVAVFELGDVVSAARNGEWKKMIKEAVEGSGAITEGLGSAVAAYRAFCANSSNISAAGNAINATGSLVKTVAFFNKLAPIAAKIGAGIGIVVSTISLVKDVGEWGDSSADKVEVVAGILSIASSVAGLLGFGPAGLVLGALALGATLFASWLKSRQEKKEANESCRACLKALNFANDTTETIVGMNTGQVKEMKARFKLEQPDLRFFAEEVSPLITWKDQVIGVSLNSFEWLQGTFFLKKNDTMSFVRACGSSATKQVRVDQRMLVIRVLDGLGVALNTLGGNRQKEKQLILQEIDDNIAENTGDRKRAFENAKAFLLKTDAPR
jgi:hypothetical protein